MAQFLGHMMLYLINRKGFIMEENLKEPNIIINGENLIDEFEKGM